MVSRFPNGSPVNISDGNHRYLLAEFNKSITPEDLVGKLKAICFVESVIEATAIYNDGLLALRADTLGFIQLVIEGSKLYATDDIDECYIFDIDFDQQNKKVFEAADGGYLLVMPQLTPGGNPKEIYAITTIQNAIETDQELYVELQVNNNDEEQGFQPIGNNIDLDDQDVCSWFDDGIGQTHFFDSICPLIEKVLKMEYNLEDITVEVGSRYTTVPDIDGGTLNLFTDGSPAPRPQPVVPLQMTMRFMTQSPILRSAVIRDRSIPVCVFNREPTVSELAGSLKAIFNYGNQVEALTAVAGESDNTILFTGTIGAMSFVIDGTQLRYVDSGDVANLWNIDYNNQHQREVSLQGTKQLVAPLFAKKDGNTVLCPFGVFSMDVDEIDVEIYVHNDDPIVNTVDLDNQDTGEWTDDIALATMLDIISEIIKMEYGVTTADVSTTTTSTLIVPDGTLNLLTD